MSISWVEIGSHPSTSPCLLQNVMGNKYKEDYELICNGLFSTLYQVMFSEEAPCLSPEGQKIVKEYSDWYMTPDGVYIMISSSTKPLH